MKAATYNLCAVILLICLGTLPNIARAQSFPDDPMAGNWVISLPDRSGNWQSGHLTVRPEGQVECVLDNEGKCLYLWRFPEDISTRTYTVSRNTFMSSTNILLDHGALQPKTNTQDRLVLQRGWNSPNGPVVDLKHVGNGRYEGEWQNGDRSGLEVWERQTPRITHVGVSAYRRQVTFEEDLRYELGEEIELDLDGDYDAFWWGNQNNMRGNRHQFQVYVYGEDLWGFHVAQFVDAPGFEPIGQWDILGPPDENGRRTVIGRSFRFATWPQATPGRKTLVVSDQEIAFNVDIPGFPLPDPEISVEDYSILGGDGRIDTFDPFRLIATFPEVPREHPRFLQILNRSQGQVRFWARLNATSDPKVFKTAWYNALPDEPNTPTGFELEWTQPDVIEDFRERLAGQWLISTSDTRITRAGVANIGDDTAVSISMQNDEGYESHYRSDGSTAYRGDDPTKVGRYFAVLRGATQEEMRQIPPVAGIPLVLPERDIIHVRFQTHEQAFAVQVSPTTSSNLTLNIGPQSDGTWAGDLTLGDELTTPVVLTKGTQFYDVVVISDQSPASQNPEFAYPFDEQGRHVGGSRTRELLLLGENIPSLTNLSIPDDQIDLVSVRPVSGQEISELLPPENASSADDELDGLLIKVALNRRVTAGAKDLVVNGQTRTWSLDFSNNFAVFSIVRKIRDNQYDPVGEAFEGDEVRLMLSPADGLILPETSNAAFSQFRLFGTVPTQTLREDTVDMERVEIEGTKFLLSDPLTLRPAAGAQSNGSSGAYLTTTDDRFTASVHVPGLHVLPPEQELRIVPFRGSPWADALARVDQCDADDREVSHWIFTNIISSDAITRRVNLTREDHAAALLLADETFELLRVQLGNVSKVRPGQERQVRATARANSNGMWQHGFAQIPGWGRAPLSDLLKEPDEIRRLWHGRILGLTTAQAERLALDGIRTGINGLIDKMNGALVSLQTTSDCNLRDLLNMVAYRQSGAIERILPRLVKPTRDGRGVEPDIEARNHVSSLWVKGNELRALKAYADADTAVASQVVAGGLILASGGLTQLAFRVAQSGYLTAAEAMATASTVVSGIDTAAGWVSVADSGRNWWNADDLAEFTEGASPIIGRNAYLSAMAAKPDAFTAVFSVVAAGVSTASFRSALKNANLNNGSRVAASLKDLSPESLNRLTVQQRADLGAYLGTIQNRVAIRNQRLGLDTKTQRALGLLSGQSRRAGTVAAAELPSVGELSGSLTRADWDRMNRPGVVLTREELQIKTDALLSGRFREPSGPTATRAINVEPDAAAPNRVRLEVPGSRVDAPDPNKTLILDLEMPSGPDHGNRLMATEELRDFASNPRVRVNGSDARFRPPETTRFVPWRDIDGVDGAASLQRRIAFNSMDEGSRVARDAEVRALIDEAAAVGNPWARRLQRDLNSGEFDYRYDAGLPEHYGGLALRADDSAGGALGVIRPTEEIRPGELQLRSPEDVATDLIHEYAHAYRGPQPYFDQVAGAAGPGILKGEYNEVRAFIAEATFVRDATVARSLNGKDFVRPAEVRVLDYAVPNLDAAEGLGQGSRLRDITSLHLQNDPQYATVYATAAERLVGLSPAGGGSTISLARRIEAIDQLFETPPLSNASAADRAIWREQMIQAVLDNGQ